MADVSPRLAPLLAQLDTSLTMALDRMQGLSDDEFWWSPAPDATTIAPDRQGNLRPMRPTDDKPRTRTIAWLIGHLGEMALLRADYTDGEHRLTPDDIGWPGTAQEGWLLCGTAGHAGAPPLKACQIMSLTWSGVATFPGGWTASCQSWTSCGG